VSAADQAVITDERAVRGTSSPVLGMVLFVASEAMFFAAFFALFAMTYTSSRVWPPKAIVSPSIGLPSVAASLMVLSSASMQMALRAVRGRNARRRGAWLAVTLALGVGFIGLQLYGYSVLSFGIKQGTYASLFYLMTAIGLAHVVGGVVLLVMVLVRSISGQLAMVRHEPAQAAAVYWHFVVIMSVALYLVFYVLPAVHPKGT
jgi:cytochrome c oxidase subunit 3